MGRRFLIKDTYWRDCKWSGCAVACVFTILTVMQAINENERMTILNYFAILAGMVIFEIGRMGMNNEISSSILIDNNGENYDPCEFCVEINTKICTTCPLSSNRDPETDIDEKLAERFKNEIL